MIYKTKLRDISKYITRCVSSHECNFQHKMSCHETSLTNKKHYIKSCMQNLKKKHETKNKQHVLF
jgi:hypothetical protein